LDQARALTAAARAPKPPRDKVAALGADEKAPEETVAADPVPDVLTR
jgi:hypothetical protein